MSLNTPSSQDFYGNALKSGGLLDMTPIRSDVLRFVKENILSVSDLTRTKRLGDILKSYSGEVTDTIYVIQNSHQKDGQAVIADLEYFRELLVYKEMVDQAIDHIMYAVALERKDDVTDIPLATVIEQFGLDVDRILALSEIAEEEN